MSIQIGWRAEPIGVKDALALPPEPLELGINSPHLRAFTERTFVLRAPHDLSCRLTMRGGRPDFRFLDDSVDLSPDQVFQFTPMKLYAAEDRPSIQWLCSNYCVADEPVWMETCAPFLHDEMKGWPGVMVPGKLDIMRWTRPFQWVFEWRDMDSPLRIKRGDPICYMRFHAPDPDATFEIVDLPESWEFRQAVQRCGRIAQYKKNALGHIEQAAERRPRRWLPRKWFR